jgi:sugar-specific transcriptional regulator TrmB
MKFKFDEKNPDLVIQLLLLLFFIALFIFALNLDFSEPKKPDKIEPNIVKTDHKIKQSTVSLDSINLIILKQSLFIDSLKQKYKKDLNGLKNYYSRLIKTAPDTCSPYLNVLINKFDSINNNCNLIVAEYTEKDSLHVLKDSANNALISAYKEQINNYMLIDSTNKANIKDLEKQVKKEKRKAFFNLFKGGGLGFALGYLTGKII